MKAAIYARVSTEKQGREQTVDSQLDALRRWATAHGHELKENHVYIDEGYSGARLDRPALDRLRDAAREGEFDVLGVYSPDRLARRYAYQVLLLEEFRKAACDVEFIERPISDDPHDQLLLQIQGAIAEYERAVLAERFRRGKLQKARAGQWGAGQDPTGYRYVPKRDGVPGHLEVDEAVAAVVWMLYRWLIDERVTVRQIIKRLAAGPWRPRNGKRLWSNRCRAPDPLRPAAHDRQAVASQPGANRFHLGTQRTLLGEVSCIKVAIVHSWAHLEARLAGMVAEVVAGPGRGMARVHPRCVLWSSLGLLVRGSAPCGRPFRRPRKEGSRLGSRERVGERVEEYATEIPTNESAGSIPVEA